MTIALEVKGTIMQNTASQSHRAALSGDPAKIVDNLCQQICQIELPATNLHVDELPSEPQALTKQGHYSVALTLEGPEPDRYAEHHFGERVYVNLWKRVQDEHPTLTISFQEPHGSDGLMTDGLIDGSEHAIKVAEAFVKQTSLLRSQEMLTLTGFAQALPTLLEAYTTSGMVPLADIVEATSGKCAPPRAAMWQQGDLSDPRGRPVVHSFESGIAQPGHQRIETPFTSLRSMALAAGDQIHNFTLLNPIGATQFITGKVGECRFQIAIPSGAETECTGQVWYSENAGMNKFDTVVKLSSPLSVQILKALGFQ
jgi:hypothetical protein